MWWDIRYYGFYQNPCLQDLLWALATDSFQMLCAGFRNELNLNLQNRDV